MNRSGQLRDTFDSALEWMELKGGQGQSIAPDVKRLEILFRALKKKYQTMPCSQRVLRQEPDDLDGILSKRPEGPGILLEGFDSKIYADKIKGAFLARAAGCTLGAAVEFMPVDQMEKMAAHGNMAFPPTDYWTVNPQPWAIRYGMSRFDEYLKQNLKHVPVDDDITYTLLGLMIFEQFGPDFTTEQVGKSWLKYLPHACTAEKVTLENLRKGRSWKVAGESGNPYVEWIGADIRSDSWGYAAPGWPEMAAELAYRDAYLSHRRGGIYGAMYFAATISAAFAVVDPLSACEIGLTEIPRASRFAKAIRWALDQSPKLKDYRHARRLVDEKFPNMPGAHAVNNACLTIFGLALGGTDVTRVIGNTVAMGLDNDCTAATAGSIVGAIVGSAGIPQHWYKPFNNKVRTYIKGHEWFKIDDVVKRFGKIACAVWSQVEFCDCGDCCEHES